MPADWYCEVDGKQHGPVTAGQLKQLATDGKLQPSHPVWKMGMKTKVPAKTVKGLFDAAAAPAAAAPSSSAADTGRLLASVLEPTQEEEFDELETIEPDSEEDLVEIETIDEEVVEEEPEPPRKKRIEPEKKPVGKVKKEAKKAPPQSRAGTATSGKPFRVMSGGVVRGPYSLEELRGLLRAGKLGEDDLIGVETWLPVATLSGLSGAVGSAPAARGDADEEVAEDLDEEFGDFEEVEEEEVKEKKPAKTDDDGSLPVDDEFHIG